MEPEDLPAGNNAWLAAMQTGREIAFYDVKPSRDGRLEWNSMRRVFQTTEEDRKVPTRSEAGQRHIRAVQSAMNEGGARSRGWQGQRSQAKHGRPLHRRLSDVSPARHDFAWSPNLRRPPPPPWPAQVVPPPGPSPPVAQQPLAGTPPEEPPAQQPQEEPPSAGPPNAPPPPCPPRSGGLPRQPIRLQPAPKAPPPEWPPPDYSPSEWPPPESPRASERRSEPGAEPPPSNPAAEGARNWQAIVGDGRDLRGHARRNRGGAARSHVANDPPEPPSAAGGRAVFAGQNGIGMLPTADRLQQKIESSEVDFQPIPCEIGREVIALIQYVRAFLMHRPDFAPFASAPEVATASYSHFWGWGEDWWPNGSGSDGNDDWRSGPWIQPAPGLGA